MQQQLGHPMEDAGQGVPGELLERAKMLCAFSTRGQKYPSTHTHSQTLPGANSMRSRAGGCSKLQSKLLGDACLQVGSGCVQLLHPTVGALAKMVLRCGVMGTVAELGEGSS